MSKTELSKDGSPIVLHVEVTAALKADARQLAKAYGLSLSAFTRLLIAQSIREHRSAQ